MKGARSNLADVLADIKNSRASDSFNYDDTGPTPAKRRSAVNYVALSGHTPRQAKPPSGKSGTVSATKSRSCIIRLFDRQVDLAPYKSNAEASLYPICRAWAHEHRLKQSEATKDLSSKDTSPIDVEALPPAKPKLDLIKEENIIDADESTDIRIPSEVRKFKRQADVEQTIDGSIDTMTQQQCLDANKQRWKKVKRDWSDTRRVYESQYKESFKILHDMFMTSQRAINS